MKLSEEFLKDIREIFTLEEVDEDEFNEYKEHHWGIKAFLDDHLQEAEEGIMCGGYSPKYEQAWEWAYKWICLGLKYEFYKDLYHCLAHIWHYDFGEGLKETWFNAKGEEFSNEDYKYWLLHVHELANKVEHYWYKSLYKEREARLEKEKGYKEINTLYYLYTNKYYLKTSQKEHMIRIYQKDYNERMEEMKNTIAKKKWRCTLDNEVIKGERFNKAKIESILEKMDNCSTFKFEVEVK